MNTTYDLINKINRAMDIYNFPKQNSVLLHLQSIRLLYDKRRYKESMNLRYMPSVENLKQRLLSIHYDIIFSRNPQDIDEFMDTAIHLRVTLPTLNITEQLNEYNRYIIPNPNNSKQTQLITFHNLTKDKQNVHNTQINESVKNSVVKLVEIYKNTHNLKLFNLNNITNILKQRNSWSPKNDKSILFIESNISTFGIDITLRELFISVYLHIINVLSEHKEELLDIFNDELKDMSGKCSTGHMSRLVNILQGFDDTFTIKIDNDKIVKNFIFNYLNEEIKNESDDVLDSIIDDPQLYRKHVYSIIENDKFIVKFKEKFGINYEGYNKFVDMYINPS